MAQREHEKRSLPYHTLLVDTDPKTASHPLHRADRRACSDKVSIDSISVCMAFVIDL